ncbi:MAG: thiamine ABC transporter substrate-binding protein [Acidimicrobiia bacterium]|nr:thiamine ABC transporter substrate-binding protein [Acidimicrobiia bacterium]
MTRRTCSTFACALLIGALVAGASLVTSRAGAASTATEPRKVTLTLVTHDSFALSKSVLRAFERETGIAVRVLPSGDAGAALNQAILTKDAPLGDLLFGVDNTFLSRALDERVFERYRSPALDRVPAAYRIDATHHATPVDHGDVCVNHDTAWFAERGIRVPRTLDDLTKPAYPGRLVVENPATSSPGLAFLLATIDRYGEGGWRSYWERLRANDVKVVSGWEQAYNGEFSAGEGSGDRPLVVSYASSPAAAVYYSDPRPAVSPIGTVLDTCFRQVEFVGILRGTGHPRAARRLVDFMLSRRFQEDVPLQMFVFPVRVDARLPAVFTKFAEVPTDPATLPPDLIGKNREQWIDEWTATVLR